MYKYRLVFSYFETFPHDNEVVEFMQEKIYQILANPDWEDTSVNEEETEADAVAQATKILNEYPHVDPKSIELVRIGEVVSFEYKP